MSKKNYSSASNKDNKDANRRTPAVPTNPIDAPIHDNHAGSSADKARLKATITGIEVGQGSSQSPTVTTSKPSTTVTRGLSRSPELATGGNADQSGSAVTKAEDHGSDAQ